MFASFGKKKNLTQSLSNDLSDKIEVFIQSLNNEKEQKLCRAIYNKATKEDHKHKSPQVGKDGTLTRCRVLLEQGADPNVLSKLEKLLIEQKEYCGYYTQDFLPALKEEIIKLAKLAKLPVFNKKKEIEQSQTRRGEIVGIILNIISRSQDKDYSGNVVLDQKNNTPKTSGSGNGSDSDSSVDSPKLSEENLVLSENSSLVSGVSASSEESLFSFIEEDNNPQNKEKTELKHLTKTRSEWPNGRNLPSKYREKAKNGVIPAVTSATSTGTQNTCQNVQLISGANKDPEKPEEKEEEVVSNKQEASNNENNSEDTILEKQPNNRGSYVLFTVGFALSAIGCFIAGITTSGLIGVGLFAIAITSAIAAAFIWYLTTPSSELTSINLSPFIADGQKR